jgi:hypothetical protein
VRWLQRLMDDERLKPRAEQDIHPLPDAPDWPLDRRIHHLECYLATLWDHVWWMNLPWYKRVAWRLLGYKAPIDHFYLKPGEPWLRS